MADLIDVEPGSRIRVRLQGREDIADGVYGAQVDTVHVDHLMVWVEMDEEGGGFAVAVMRADEDGVWFWSKRPAV
ncbi:hypothetical protein ACTPOK_29420 [Streptomyces inhibens]|uniref:hypothetical protein n=1 Tax=Streptomyces inhibens TaxID=2293571 RepID=UPI00402AD5E5